MFSNRIWNYNFSHAFSLCADCLSQIWFLWGWAVIIVFFTTLLFQAAFNILFYSRSAHIHWGISMIYAGLLVMWYGIGFNTWLASILFIFTLHELGSREREKERFHITSRQASRSIEFTLSLFIQFFCLISDKRHTYLLYFFLIPLEY